MPIISIQCLGQRPGPLLADGALAVFHLGDMTLGDAGEFGQVQLGKALPSAGTAQIHRPFRLVAKVFAENLCVPA